MNFQQITSDELTFNPFSKVKGCFLLTAGNEEKFNTMTAGWGSFGVMWGMKVLNAVVRPSRYTYQFMEQNELFTASFFSQEYAGALNFCGARSGRDVDKVKETGLTPLFLDGAIAFEEASEIYVCKKIYVDDIVPRGFVGKNASDLYPNGDFHRSYYGEILKIYKK